MVCYNKMVKMQSNLFVNIVLTVVLNTRGDVAAALFVALTILCVLSSREAVVSAEECSKNSFG